MDMATDVQLLILSEGKSNILPADLVVPFQPSSVGSSAITDIDALEAWGWYLSNVRSLPHSIGSEMQQVHIRLTRILKASYVKLPIVLLRLKVM